MPILPMDSHKNPPAGELGKNRGSQAETPAPPRQNSCLERWDRRFRLPFPSTGELFPSDARPSALALGVVLCCLLAPGNLAAQASPEIREIMDRLERLEQQNKALTEEVHQLRQELAGARGQTPASTPTLEERVAVEESRTEEQAQSKVEASQHFPIRITGMALFNAFRNSEGSGGQQYPLFAWPERQASGGGSFYQSTIGLEYMGPQSFLGGSVHGSVYMDFAGGTGAPLDQDFRLRTGSIEIDWTNRSIAAGLLSPIFAPREPASLAQVEFSPLASAGNLWLWIPQVRFEQKVRFGDEFGLRAQAGVVQTEESVPYQGSTAKPEPARPGIEGRVEAYFGAEDGRRIEIAPGFHTSDTHVAGTSVPSNLFSLDWFTNPWRKLEFTGAFFTGQNVGPVGGLEGFTILPSGLAIPVHSKGGWGQLTFLATRRLSFHIFSGLENDREADLTPYAIDRNWLYGANFFYRLAPNVLLGVETSQARSRYVETGMRLNNHYDLALAYLF